MPDEIKIGDVVRFRGATSSGGKAVVDMSQLYEPHANYKPRLVKLDYGGPWIKADMLERVPPPAPKYTIREFDAGVLRVYKHTVGAPSKWMMSVNYHALGISNTAAEQLIHNIMSNYGYTRAE